MGKDRQALILLIEDDPGVARLEQLQLERTGYTVAIAPTAASARDRVALGDVALLLLDQELNPGTSGLDFFRQLKEAGHDVPGNLGHRSSRRAPAGRGPAPGVRDFVPKTRIS